MLSQNQKGFTLVEVILFFALSSAFIVIAFMGIKGKNESVQFTDSMRSLQNFIASEQNKVLNGVNSSPKSAGDPLKDTGSNPDYVLVGRIITFGEDVTDLTKVNIDVLYGDKYDEQYYESNSLESDIDKIHASDPRPDVTAESFNISWDTGFLSSKSKNSSNADVNRLGWLRSPVSNNIIPIVFHSTASSLDGTLNDYYKMSAPESDIATQVNARFCFEGIGGRVASINFDADAKVNLVFDDGDCK